MLARASAEIAGAGAIPSRNDWDADAFRPALRGQAPMLTARPRPLTTLPAALLVSVHWGPPAAAAMRMRIWQEPGDVDRPVARAARAGPLTLVPGPTAR